MNSPRKQEVRALIGDEIVNMGHRGTRGLAPENTLISFQKANLYTRYFELDTMLCGSGELVVIHDETVDRTTNGKGLISDLSLHEILKLDAGSFFSPEFSQARIPSLRELLETMPVNCIFDIEVKSAGVEKDRFALAHALASLINELKIGDRVFISSFDAFLLEKVKDTYPNLLRGQLLDLEWDENLWSRSLPDLILPNHKSITKPWIDSLKRQGFTVIPYTVNQKEDWACALELGVHGIITDRPDLLKEYLVTKVTTQER